jgi:hypothetical protein
MTEEQIALAKRAVACNGWRWMSGMLRGDGFRCIWVDEEERELAAPTWCKNGMEWKNGRTGSKDLPDLTDHSTLGCLLALVREHHKEPRLAVVPTGKGWSVSRVWLRSPHDRVAGVHTLEAEALVAALEAAP